MARIIGVDFDDVLIECNAALCGWHNENYGTTLTKKDVFSYELGRVWGCTPKEAVNRVRQFFHSHHHSNVLPVCGARDGLSLLGEEKAYIVTARPHIVSDVTVALLQKHFPRMIGRIHFVGKEFDYDHHESTKPEVCLKLGVEVFIDDSLVHARDIGAVGIPVLLFDNPWNQTEDLPPNVERVYSWDEIVERLR